MCTTVIVTFGVSIAEGLAGGVLKNYRLNDLKYQKTHHRGDQEDDYNDDGSNQLLPNSYNDFKRRAVADFNNDDKLYEEFNAPDMYDSINQDDPENRDINRYI